MNKTSATVVADSVNQQGDRLTSLLITFPRILLSEINTHRMLSKNTSSSRAIPFNKMVEAVVNDPFTPIAWQKHHSGMQGNEYLVHPLEIKEAQQMWKRSLDYALASAKDVYKTGVTKQLCNRLLEPFMWTTMLITGSKEGWENFFNLRCPSYFGRWKSWKETCENSGTIFEAPLLERLQNNDGQAEIHMMALAECIYDAMNESIPKQLEAGEWHIPFYNSINIDKVKEITPKGAMPNPPDEDSSALEGMFYSDVYDNVIKISTAMAARTSYTVVGEEKDIDYKKMIDLHDRLIAQNPPHSSPMEHCARAMDEVEYTSSKATGYTRKGKDQYGWCRNFKGFIPYRHIIETEKYGDI